MRRLSRVTGTPGSRVAGDSLSRYPHGSVTVVPGALGSRVTVAVADRHAGGERDTQSGLGSLTLAGWHLLGPGVMPVRPGRSVRAGPGPGRHGPDRWPGAIGTFLSRH